MKTLLTISFLLFATVAQAQNRTALWDMLDVPTIAYAQGLTYKLYVTPSGGSTSSVTLTGVTCAGTVPTANCTAQLPTSVSVPIGTRAELTATDTTSGVESPRSNPFIKPTGAPSNFRLTLLEQLKSLIRHGRDSLATLGHSITRGLK